MTVFRSISETMFKVTHMVMRYAPVGVFALIAVTVANFGFASPWPLAKLVLLVHFAIIFFALVVLGIVARLCGLSIWILIRILKDELILAYSTASSESVLPRIIEKMEATARQPLSPVSWYRPVTHLTSTAPRYTRASPPFLSRSYTVSTCRCGRKLYWC